nr:MAG TPA: hypothetical protein [Caudoviricetes sp.]
MKLQTLNKSLFGSRLSVPVDGTVNIDNNGIITVSDACAEQLLTLPDWQKYEKEQTEKEVSVDKDKEVIAAIKKMSLKEAIEAAVGAGYPEEEYAPMKKNQKLMAAYLIKKYKAAVEAGE